MAQTFTGRKRVRKSFGKIEEVAEMPNLIEVQRSSYEQFLQRETRSVPLMMKVPLGVMNGMSPM